MDPTSRECLPQDSYVVISHEVAERRATDFCQTILGDATLLSAIEDLGFNFANRSRLGHLQTTMRFSDLLSKEGMKLSMKGHNEVMKNLYNIVWTTKYVYDLALLKYDREKGR